MLRKIVMRPMILPVPEIEAPKYLAAVKPYFVNIPPTIKKYSPEEGNQNTIQIIL
jgi:hypothetical protein